MAMQFSVAVRNARADATETTISTSPKLYIRTSTPPANCAAADSGSLLVTMDLPSDWLSNATNAVKSKAGAWSGTAAGDGVAGHFRIKDSAGTTCHIQGTCGQGSGDMSLDNTNIATGQVVTVSAVTLTDGNA